MSPPSWRRAVAWIPRGRPLPPEVWQSRHRWVIGILAAQSVGIPFYAVYRGHSAGEALIAMLVPSATVLLASWKRIPSRARAALAATGLMAVSAVVVLLSDGVTEAHFHYLVMIPVAAVRTEGDVSRVFLIKDGAAHEQLIQLGLLEGDRELLG